MIRSAQMKSLIVSSILVVAGFTLGLQFSNVKEANANSEIAAVKTLATDFASKLQAKDATGLEQIVDSNYWKRMRFTANNAPNGNFLCHDSTAVLINPNLAYILLERRDARNVTTLQRVVFTKTNGQWKIASIN